MMNQQLFKNKTTRREVIILQRRDKLVQVKYTGTGLTAWLRDADFERMFNPI